MAYVIFQHNIIAHNYRLYIFGVVKLIKTNSNKKEFFYLIYSNQDYYNVVLKKKDIALFNRVCRLLSVNTIALI